MLFRDFVATGRPVFIGLVISVLGLGMSACGRRGALEPPPEVGAAPAQSRPAASSSRTRTQKVSASSPSPTLASTPQAVTEDTPDDETDEDDGAQSVLPTPNPKPTSRKRGRFYTVPKEPFVLDPLL